MKRGRDGLCLSGELQGVSGRARTGGGREHECPVPTMAAAAAVAMVVRILIEFSCHEERRYVVPSALAARGPGFAAPDGWI
jgi:hypothetical protein